MSPKQNRTDQIRSDPQCKGLGLGLAHGDWLHSRLPVRGPVPVPEPHSSGNPIQAPVLRCLTAGHAIALHLPFLSSPPLSSPLLSSPPTNIPFFTFLPSLTATGHAVQCTLPFLYKPPPIHIRDNHFASRAFVRPDNHSLNHSLVPSLRLFKERRPPEPRKLPIPQFTSYVLYLTCGHHEITNSYPCIYSGFHCHCSTTQSQPRTTTQTRQRSHGYRVDDRLCLRDRDGRCNYHHLGF